MRLDEIYKTDKSRLSVSAKHELRKEVIAIREKIQDLGIYISTGALIIILILLIILL